MEGRPKGPLILLRAVPAVKAPLPYNDRWRSTPMSLTPRCALLVLAGLAAAGGGPATQTPRGPIEHATVEMVLIETYVNDSSGRPIRGLGPDDFVLMVDGHVEPIASVEFHEVGVGATPEAGAGRPAEVPAPPAAPGPLIAATAPRRFILFFEDGTSAPEGLTNARRAADDFLTAKLSPTDQVAIACYDRKLRMLHDFTTDRASLRRVVQESLRDPRRFSDYAVELSRRQEEIHAGEHNNNGLLSLEQAALLVRNYAAEDLVRLRGVLSALR